MCFNLKYVVKNIPSCENFIKTTVSILSGFVDQWRQQEGRGDGFTHPPLAQMVCMCLSICNFDTIFVYMIAYDMKNYHQKIMLNNYSSIYLFLLHNTALFLCQARLLKPRMGTSTQGGFVWVFYMTESDLPLPSPSQQLWKISTHHLIVQPTF